MIYNTNGQDEQNTNNSNDLLKFDKDNKARK